MWRKRLILENGNPSGLITLDVAGVLKSKLHQSTEHFNFSIYLSLWLRPSRGLLPCLVLEDCVVSRDLEDLLVAGSAYTHCSFSWSSDIAEFLISCSALQYAEIFLYRRAGKEEFFHVKLDISLSEGRKGENPAERKNSLFSCLSIEKYPTSLAYFVSVKSYMPRNMRSFSCSS